MPRWPRLESRDQRAAGATIDHQSSVIDILATRKTIQRMKSALPSRLCETSLCKYDVVKQVLKSRGFQQCKLNDPNWIVLWIDTGVALERVLAMSVTQKINHFPGMDIICRKSRLARSLARMHRLFPKDYSFTPRTWRLPSDLAALQLALRSNSIDNSRTPKKTFIAKPDAGCQGKGIQLFSDEKGFKQAMERASTMIPPSSSSESQSARSSLSSSNSSSSGSSSSSSSRATSYSHTPHLAPEIVVQEYIAKPCLLDGHKFDLRIYALVLSVSPLQIYVHKEGLVRLATTKYQAPNNTNYQQVTMHLTNYAINKDGPGFEQHDPEAEKVGSNGHKRSLQFIWEWMDRNRDDGDIDSTQAWELIKDVIVKTIITAQPNLSKAINACRQRIESNRTVAGAASESASEATTSYQPCFEVLGFDILLDHKFTPWVLEVNHSPSFTCDSELDRRVKSAVIGHTLDLLVGRAETSSGLCDSGADMTGFETLSSSKVRPYNGWEISYPPSHPSKQAEYSKYIQAATTLFLNNDTELTKSRNAYREKIAKEKVEREAKVAHIRERARIQRANATLGVAPARLTRVVPFEFNVREPKPKPVRTALRLGSVDLLFHL
ncbi:hypothetical protein SeMB42_g01957 [Synchytrium endobioticum]|uniref:Tubulin-tyrosine ligase n=1 Tax=Synchytrium endobioticum TaxID=286115 RepID=A0A507DIC8_9FUNG|nr:hypothetical protein SeLEV6574_g03685 [Synchytrium endobioticum]TPX51333.1 hypothetical protein SeMB42_g01957 [Synchytrium endobioticum]